MNCFQLGCHRPVTETVRGQPCCEPHAILRRAGWQCEAVIDNPLPWKEGKIRCVVVGSEIWVYNGEARCPRHSHN